MRLLTAAEQRELDRLAAAAGLPTRVLMENAGAAVAREVVALRPGRVAVCCGPGNNGGDGFVAARFLRETLGDAVTVVATARDKLKGDALAAAQAWLGPVASQLPEADVVLDAVFGSGLSRNPAVRPTSTPDSMAGDATALRPEPRTIVPDRPAAAKPARPPAVEPYRLPAAAPSPVTSEATRASPRAAASVPTAKTRPKVTRQVAAGQRPRPVSRMMPPRRLTAAVLILVVVATALTMVIALTYR